MGHRRRSPSQSSLITSRAAEAGTTTQPTPHRRRTSRPRPLASSSRIPSSPSSTSPPTGVRRRASCRVDASVARGASVAAQPAARRRARRAGWRRGERRRAGARLAAAPTGSPAARGGREKMALPISTRPRMRRMQPASSSPSTPARCGGVSSAQRAPHRQERQGCLRPRRSPWRSPWLNRRCRAAVLPPPQSLGAASSMTHRESLGAASTMTHRESLGAASCLSPKCSWRWKRSLSILADSDRCQPGRTRAPSWGCRADRTWCAA